VVRIPAVKSAQDIFIILCPVKVGIYAFLNFVTTQPLCQVWWRKREAEDIYYMSLFLLENVGSGLNIREEGVKDWKAEKWYVAYT